DRRDTAGEFAQTISRVASNGFVRGQLKSFAVVRGNTVAQSAAAPALEHALYTSAQDENSVSRADPVAAALSEIGAAVMEAAGANPVGAAMAEIQARLTIGNYGRVDRTQRAVEARMKG